MRSNNILITSAARHFQFPIALDLMLKEMRLGSVFLSNANTDCAACHSGLGFFVLPECTARDYLSLLLRKCKSNRIAVIIPGSDIDAEILSFNRKELLQNSINLACGGYEFVASSSDKVQAGELFRKLTLSSYAKIYSDIDDVGEYPCVIKPRKGCASIDSFVAHDRDEARFYLRRSPNSIIQKYAKGTEVSIDIISSVGGDVLGVVPRERKVVRSGVIDKGRSINDTALIDAGVEFAEANSVSGICNIQGGYNKNQKLEVFDVNPRVPGGIMLSFESNRTAFSAFLRSFLGFDMGKIDLSIKEVNLLTFEGYLFFPGKEGITN